MTEEERPSIGNYWLLKVIGIGSTAKVKLGEHKVTHTKVAIKIIKKKKLAKDTSFQKKIQREMSLMRIFDHPHLLKLYDILETEEKIYLVLEYAKNGELFDYIQCQPLTAPMALRFFRQIIFGLDFLHTHSLCHRDMKLENILLDEYDNLKIGDFGFARWMKNNVADTSCGSPHYAAPEVIKGEGGYDGKAADIWSCGVIFYTLLCGRLPFVDESVKNLLVKIRTANFKMPDFPDPIKDLLRRMLCVDPQQRITLEQIKAHECFKLLMPQGFVFPTPFPEVSIPDPIDPNSISPDIMGILKQIGFDNEEDLRQELIASQTTEAKQFLFMMLRRVSFDTLPWCGNPIPDVKLKIDPTVVINFEDPFLADEQYQVGIPFVKYTVAENCTKKHEELVIAIQQYLTKNDFEFYYPHDLLILSRKKDGSLEIFFRFEYLPEEKITVKVFLTKGDDDAFNTLSSQILEQLK